MRKANKQSTGLLPQERFIKLLNDMVDIGWEPFNLYGKDYRFSHSDNPEFPYRLSYIKHDEEFHINLSDNMIFSNDSRFLDELLDEYMLDISKFKKEVELHVDLYYRADRNNLYYASDDSLSWSIFLQRTFGPKRLDEFFKYLIEG